MNGIKEESDVMDNDLEQSVRAEIPPNERVARRASDVSLHRCSIGFNLFFFYLTGWIWRTFRI